MPQSDFDRAYDRAFRGAVEGGAAIVGGTIALGIRALIGAGQTAGKVNPAEMERRLRGNRPVIYGAIIGTLECASCQQIISDDSFICDYCGENIVRQIQVQQQQKRKKEESIQAIGTWANFLFVVGFLCLVAVFWLVFGDIVYQSVPFLLTVITILFTTASIVGGTYVRASHKKAQGGEWNNNEGAWKNFITLLPSKINGGAWATAVVLPVIAVVIAGWSGFYVRNPANEPTFLDALVTENFLAVRKLRRLTDSRWWEPVLNSSQVQNGYERARYWYQDDEVAYHYLNAAIQGNCEAVDSYLEKRGVGERWLPACEQGNIRVTDVSGTSPNYFEYQCSGERRAVIAGITGRIILNGNSYDEVALPMCRGENGNYYIAQLECRPREICF